MQSDRRLIKYTMTDASPLRTTRLMNDVLYAISMYFASIIGEGLVANDNGPFVFVILFVGLSIQVAIEHSVVHWFNRHKTLWAEIIVESIYMLSRTLAFVIVTFVIDLMVNHREMALWGAHILWPVIVIFVGIAFMKHFARAQKDKKI